MPLAEPQMSWLMDMDEQGGVGLTIAARRPPPSQLAHQLAAAVRAVTHPDPLVWCHSR